MSQEERKNKPAKKNRKKGSIWLKILIVFLTILLVLLMTVAIAMDYVLGKLGRFDDPQTETDGTAPATDVFDTDSTIEGQENFTVMEADDVTLATVEEFDRGDVINIMLIGQDRRPGEIRARSDSMILVSLNPAKNAIQLTSFMRDTYVQIPGWANNRLNAPYAYEGTELMNETFKKNFGLNIDGNVMVDFSEFTNIINILGGVDIDMSWEEAGYMVNHGFSCSEGVNHLDGDAALEFVRMRYVSGGDYGRTERQRRVLSALANGVRDADIGTIMNLIDQVLPHIVTNLTDTQIISYATTGLGLLADGAGIESMRIPQDDAHYGAMIDGMAVLVPDLEMCREDLEEFIYSDID